MTGRIAVLAALVGVAVAGRATADLAPRPNPAQPAIKQTAPLTVEIDPAAKEPRLVVPRQLIFPRPGFAPRGPARPPEQEQADAGPELPRLHLVAAGLALALAVSSGGLWLARRGRVSGRGLMVVAGAVVLSGAAAVWANVGIPRPPANPVPGPAPAPAALFSGQVTVEVVPQGDSIRLIGTRDMIDKLKAPPAANP
jgi:hypothetical protein